MRCPSSNVGSLLILGDTADSCEVRKTVAVSVIQSVDPSHVLCRTSDPFQKLGIYCIKFTLNIRKLNPQNSLLQLFLYWHDLRLKL